MEKIVQCIRTSDNPQTHHQALLVLTTAAKIYPVKTNTSFVVRMGNKTGINFHTTLIRKLASFKFLYVN